MTTVQIIIAILGCIWLVLLQNFALADCVAQLDGSSGLALQLDCDGETVSVSHSDTVSFQSDSGIKASKGSKDTILIKSPDALTFSKFDIVNVESKKKVKHLIQIEGDKSVEINNLSIDSCSIKSVGNVVGLTAKSITVNNLQLVDSTVNNLITVDSEDSTFDGISLKTSQFSGDYVLKLNAGANINSVQVEKVLASKQQLLHLVNAQCAQLEAIEISESDFKSSGVGLVSSDGCSVSMNDVVSNKSDVPNWVYMIDTNDLGPKFSLNSFQSTDDTAQPSNLDKPFNGQFIEWPGGPFALYSESSVEAAKFENLNVKRFQSTTSKNVKSHTYVNYITTDRSVTIKDSVIKSSTFFVTCKTIKEKGKLFSMQNVEIDDVVDVEQGFKDVLPGFLSSTPLIDLGNIAFKFDTVSVTNSNLPNVASIIFVNQQKPIGGEKSFNNVTIDNIQVESDPLLGSTEAQALKIQIANLTSTLTISDFTCKNYEVQGLENQSSVGQSAACIGVKGAGFVEIKDSHFEGNIGGRGGAAGIENIENVLVKNAKFIRNKGSSNGGGLFVAKVSKSLTVQDCEFVENESQMSGGGFGYSSVPDVQTQITTIAQDLVIQRNKFVGNRAKIRGGAIDAQEFKGSIKVSQNTFNGNQAAHGGAIRFITMCFPQIENNKFYNNIALQQGGAMLLDNVIDNTQCLKQSEFMDIQTQITINFQDLRAFPDEPSYAKQLDNHLADVPTLVKSCEFVNNTAYTGGALYLHQFVGRADETVNIIPYTMSDNTFTDNTATKHGGAVYFGGLIGTVNFDIPKFYGNIARNGMGGAIAIGEPGDPQNGVRIGGGEFTGNKAVQGGAIAVTGMVSLLLEDLRATENNAKESGGAVWCDGCVRVLLGLQGSPAQLNENMAGTQGGAVCCIGCGLVAAESSSVSGNVARFGGGIYLKGGAQSVAILQKAVLESNVAKAEVLDGGASGKGRTLLNEDNEALGSSDYRGVGGALYAEDGVVLLTDSSIIGNEADIGAAITWRQSTSPSDLSFLLESEQIFPEENLALLCQSNSDCTQHADKLNKAAVKLAQTKDNQGLYLHETSIENNVIGGATDSGYAPVLYTSWSDLQAGKYVKNDIKVVAACDGTTSNRNDYVNLLQSINEDGPSALDASNESTFGHKLSSGTQACLEEAAEQNVNKGSTLPAWSSQIVQTKLVQFNTDDGGKWKEQTGTEYDIVSHTANNDNESAPLMVIRGGEDVFVGLELLDAFGNKVPEPMAVQVRPAERSQGQFVLGQTTAFSKNGRLNFKFNIQKEPGEASLQFVQVDQQYISPGAVCGDDQCSLQQPVVLRANIVVRPCVIGEVPQSDGQTCFRCEAGTYSLNVTQTCATCPTLAKCTNGSVIVPTSFQWHSGPQSARILQCPNPRACKYDCRLNTLQSLAQDLRQTQLAQQQLKSVAVTDNGLMDPLEELLDTNTSITKEQEKVIRNEYAKQMCSHQYSGPLCGECNRTGWDSDYPDAKRWGKRIPYECVQCHNFTVGWLVLGFIAATVFLSVSIFFTLKINGLEWQDEVSTSDLMKVFMVFLQRLSIVLRVHVASFFGASGQALFGAVGDTTGAFVNPLVVSLDCLFRRKPAIGFGIARTVTLLFSPTFVALAALPIALGIRRLIEYRNRRNNNQFQGPLPELDITEDQSGDPNHQVVVFSVDENNNDSPTKGDVSATGPLTQQKSMQSRSSLPTKDSMASSYMESDVSGSEGLPRGNGNTRQLRMGADANKHLVYVHGPKYGKDEFDELPRKSSKLKGSGKEYGHLTSDYRRDMKRSDLGIDSSVGPLTSKDSNGLSKTSSGVQSRSSGDTNDSAWTDDQSRTVDSNGVRRLTFATPSIAEEENDFMDGSASQGAVHDASSDGTRTGSLASRNAGAPSQPGSRTSSGLASIASKASKVSSRVSAPVAGGGLVDKAGRGGEHLYGQQTGSASDASVQLVNLPLTQNEQGDLVVAEQPIASDNNVSLPQGDSAHSSSVVSANRSSDGSGIQQPFMVSNDVAEVDAVSGVDDKSAASFSFNAEQGDDAKSDFSFGMGGVLGAGASEPGQLPGSRPMGQPLGPVAEGVEIQLTTRAGPVAENSVQSSATGSMQSAQTNSTLSSSAAPSSYRLGAVCGVGGGATRQGSDDLKGQKMGILQAYDMYDVDSDDEKVFEDKIYDHDGAMGRSKVIRRPYRVPTSTDVMIVLFITLCTLFYPLLCTTVFSTFSCVSTQSDALAVAGSDDREDSKHNGYWVQDLELECFSDPKHRTLAIFAGIFGIPFIVCGMPLLVFIILRRRLSKLRMPAVQHRLLWLYHPYRPSFYYWEAVKMIETMFHVAALQLGYRFSAVVRSIMLLSVAVLSLINVLIQRPHRFRAALRLEIVGGIANLVSLLFLVSALEDPGTKTSVVEQCSKGKTAGVSSDDDGDVAYKQVVLYLVMVIEIGAIIWFLIEIVRSLRGRMVTTVRVAKEVVSKVQRQVQSKASNASKQLSSRYSSKTRATRSGSNVASLLDANYKQSDRRVSTQDSVSSSYTDSAFNNA